MTNLFELNYVWVHKRPMVHDLPLYVLGDLHASDFVLIGSPAVTVQNSCSALHTEAERQQ